MSEIWDKPYYARRKETDDLAKQYGLNRDDYVSTDIDGERGMSNDDYKKYEQAISDAAANDYDTRRSIEAAQLSGYEGADELGKGISNLQEAANARDFLQNIHENELGNSGKFSSANDYGNVTNFFVDNDRSQFQDEMKKSFGDYIEENQPETADTVNQQAKPIEYSPELQAAHSRVSEYEKGTNATNNVYDKSLDGDNPAITGEGKDQRNHAAQNFADAYKLELSTDIKRSRV